MAAHIVCITRWIDNKIRFIGHICSFFHILNHYTYYSFKIKIALHNFDLTLPELSMGHVFCYNVDMKTALILIDIQNDYFPGGKGELENPIVAATQARELLDFFRWQGWPTVHIQHVATRPSAITFLPDTEGVKIHASIAPLPSETIIVKHFPNSFRETDLLEHLKGLDVDRLVLSGMMTHMCVDASMRAAVDFGFPVLLAADACATRALTYGEMKIPAQYVHAAFLAALKSYGQVLQTEEIRKQLQGKN